MSKVVKDPEFGRQVHLLRAGVAALVASALVLGLVAYGPQSASDAPAEASGAAEAALSLATQDSQQQPAAPLSEAAASIEGADAPPVLLGQASSPAGTEAAATSDAVSRAEDAGPADSAAETAEIAAATADTAAGTSATLVPVAAQELPVTEAPAARTPTPPPGPGYMVQLGVFAAPENADRLREDLVAQGFPAHVQSRVVVGPFPDRKSADAAHAKLHRAHQLQGVIVPPRKP